MHTSSIILISNNETSISFEKALIQKVADYARKGLEGSDNTEVLITFVRRFTVFNYFISLRELC